MSRWSLLIYGIAAVLGVQTLLALMVQHRRRTFNNLMNAENNRREAESAIFAGDQQALPDQPTETHAKAA